MCVSETDCLPGGGVGAAGGTAAGGGGAGGAAPAEEVVIEELGDDMSPFAALPFSILICFCRGRIKILIYSVSFQWGNSEKKQLLIPILLIPSTIF